MLCSKKSINLVLIDSLVSLLPSILSINLPFSANCAQAYASSCYPPTLPLTNLLNLDTVDVQVALERYKSHNLYFRSYKTLNATRFTKPYKKLSKIWRRLNVIFDFSFTNISEYNLQDRYFVVYHMTCHLNRPISIK